LEPIKGDRSEARSPFITAKKQSNKREIKEDEGRRRVDPQEVRIAISSLSLSLSLLFTSRMDEVGESVVPLVSKKSRKYSLASLV
jgi:hypothetical protein